MKGIRVLRNILENRTAGIVSGAWVFFEGFVGEKNVAGCSLQILNLQLQQWFCLLVGCLKSRLKSITFEHMICSSCWLLVTDVLSFVQMQVFIITKSQSM